MNEALESIMDVRDDFMISPAGDSEPTFRTAHFLKPIANSIDGQVPEITEPKEWPLKFHFNGWHYSSKKWVGWLNALYPKFESLWKKVGIFEAIMSTRYKLVKSQNLAFGVAEKWCSKTNTFLFPWGEATITLEDVMVLGGYTVVGDSVFTPLKRIEMKEIEKQLIQARKEPWKTKRGKASASAWMNIFINSGSEIEHEAFITTWLSMFVFPYKGFINKDVFPIAIHLARGNTIALAPAVLACIYEDLSCLKQTLVHLTKGPVVSEVDLELTLQSPFYLVQIWLWERFKNLQPEPNLINNGDPVLARWHKVKALAVDDVRLALNLAMDDFVWRPYVRYAAMPRVFYPENEIWVINFDSDLDKVLLSFVSFLRASELVGIGSIIKQYLPHRVAMQFGLDQDVPGRVPRFNQTKAIAWENYCRPICDGNLYIPSKLFEADVSTGYAMWWKKSVLDHLDSVKSIGRQKRSARRSSKQGTRASKANRSSDDDDVLPGFRPKHVSIMISGKGCDDGSKARKGDIDVDVLGGLEANGKIDADYPAGFSPQYKSLNHYNSAKNCKAVLEENQSGGISRSLGIRSYEYEQFSKECSSVSTSESNHGAVKKILPLAKLYEKDNIEGSIEGLEEDSEDANGSKRSRLSSDSASLYGTQEADHIDSSETNVDELEQRINKLEAELEERLEKVKRETAKLIKARSSSSATRFTEGSLHTHARNAPSTSSADFFYSETPIPFFPLPLLSCLLHLPSGAWFVVLTFMLQAVCFMLCRSSLLVHQSRVAGTVPCLQHHHLSHSPFFSCHSLFCRPKITHGATSNSFDRDFATSGMNLVISVVAPRGVAKLLTQSDRSWWLMVKCVKPEAVLQACNANGGACHLLCFLSMERLSDFQACAEMFIPVAAATAIILKLVGEPLPGIEVKESWRVADIPIKDKFQYTYFAHKINSFDTAPKKLLASDSRLRPDRLALEKGNLSTSGYEKSR
ncbi:hypothetical protein RIF29_20454 [Crotalaria pallida]|uniref:Aminotransferase-like plant mobile domain-containing protein n=1 Tax=Crotalaria pallida TaxID=3830 RepID=A0AAN9I8P7_CROPI